MWPDRVSNPGPLTYESGVLPIALRGPANSSEKLYFCLWKCTVKLQWLGHLWNHENMLETGVVRANEYYSLRQVMRHKGIYFRLSLI